MRVSFLPGFDVGNHSLSHALDKVCPHSYLQDGGAAFHMVIGDFGSGRSHYLYCLRNLIWERGFAVSKVNRGPVEHFFARHGPSPPPISAMPLRKTK